ncbi:MAG: HEAT repeat domain-containing protein [Candidatus Binatia bacterium]|nr:HEAT repeat domain-containing protein [Candidatus Binatia bacterium]
MYRLVVLLLGLLLVPPTARAEDDPYLLTIDLGEAIRVLGDEDSFEREPLEILLVGLGDRAVPALRKGLATEDEAVRMGIIEVLTETEAEGASALLLERAKMDDSIYVRVEAISGLVSRDAPEAAEVVSSALASDEPLLYRAAFGGCGRYCTSPEQLDRIVAFAFSEPVVQMVGPRGALVRTAGIPEHRAAVVAALERGAAPKLVADDPEVRVRAAMLLAALEDERAAPGLEVALDQEIATMLRVQAIVALGGVGNESTVTTVGASLATLSPLIRPAACKALSILAYRGVEGASAEAVQRGCPGAK